MRLSPAGLIQQSPEGENQCLNSELWHACAGPLVSLPPVGSRVVYFPQGHSEQVAATTNREVDSQIPNYPTLPPQLVCQLHNLTMHADIETDEVYAQMTLQPLSAQEQKEASFIPADLGISSKQPTNYFCKTLTASDTSTHGGFSVPRRAAEKVFPPLDFNQQPPCQELIARDLHDNEWKFRHIFRGQPKRHLLTTGWSVFVSNKRLVAGDSVIFIWNEKNQLFLGIRRATRPQTVIPSLVLSSDSMHLGLLAAAAHAAETNSRFTIFYNPRASPSEFVIPLAKYVKAVYHTRVSVGMRFRMLFETEESGVRRYMGTITGISDSDPTRWPKSHWRSVKVGWDESAAGERQTRVSLWDIEPFTTFPMYPSPFPLRLKRPWPMGLPTNGMRNDDMGMNSPLLWLRANMGDQIVQPLNLHGTGMTPWMQPRLDMPIPGMQNDVYQSMGASALQNTKTADPFTDSLSSFPQYHQTLDAIRTPGLLQPHVSQLSHTQPTIVQQPMRPHVSQMLSQTHSQPHALPHSDLQQPVRPQNYSNDIQQQQHQKDLLQHQHEQVTDHQHFHQMSTSSHTQSPPMQAMSAAQQQNFSSSITNSISPLQNLTSTLPLNGTPHFLFEPRSFNILTAEGWPQKRFAVDTLSSRPPQSISVEVDPLGLPDTNVSQNSFSLPPFPGRECSINQEGANDPQCHAFFSVQSNSSSLHDQNLMSSTRGVCNHGDSISSAYASSTYMSAEDSNFTANLAMTRSAGMDESTFLHSSVDAGQANQPSRNFVKVYMSGSFGRSLDITKFSSYHELRSELARMFGLEGQLEDPLRSGWQLVFVDRENDVLLLGDDPWQEFVNSVWCIKILSPQDMQQMGKEGLELLNAVPRTRLQNSSNEDFARRQEAGNVNAGIQSVASAHY